MITVVPRDPVLNARRPDAYWWIRRRPWPKGGMTATSWISVEESLPEDFYNAFG